LDIIIPDPNFERTLKRLKSEGNTELVTQLAALVVRLKSNLT
jgi:hypothetical protein